MNYYKRHIGDYLKDTAHLSLLVSTVCMRGCWMCTTPARLQYLTIRRHG